MQNNNKKSLILIFDQNNLLCVVKTGAMIYEKFMNILWVLFLTLSLSRPTSTCLIPIEFAVRAEHSVAAVDEQSRLGVGRAGSWGER